jgi:hypothetical protein
MAAGVTLSECYSYLMPCLAYVVAADYYKKSERPLLAFLLKAPPAAANAPKGGETIDQA